MRYGDLRAGASYNEVLTAAVQDFREHGYDSQQRLDFWMYELAEAAERSLVPESVLDQNIKSILKAKFERAVTKGGILKYHPGVKKYDLERIAPHLRGELDQRIVASAQLIKLNREEMIQRTLRRFSGWSTSIPVGGSDTESPLDIKKGMKLADMSFLERRVMIDQGHKMIASLNQIVAKDNNALAVIWHSHWRDPSYNYRPDHKDRDEKVYAIKDNWAIQKGLMKRGKNPYYDDITQVGQEVYCRCFAQFVYSLNRLPDDMLTKAGAEAIGRFGIKA